MEKFVSRMIIIWIAFLIISLSIFSNQINSQQMAYYKFGPSDSLNVLGIAIDNYTKYIIVLLFCGMNSIMRTTTHNILTPWITNSVQDITKKKDKNMYWFAYEATYVVTIYSWLDWYIYINVLLSQADIFLVEIISDLIMAGLVTRYYLTNEHGIVISSTLSPLPLLSGKGNNSYHAIDKCDDTNV